MTDWKYGDILRLTKAYMADAREWPGASPEMPSYRVMFIRRSTASIHFTGIVVASKMEHFPIGEVKDIYALSAFRLVERA